jgi:hypothetical protein
MAHPILVVDTSEIESANVAEVKRLFADLVAFVEEHEAEPLVYGVYFDETGTRMTVAQIHPRSRWNATWTSRARCSGRSPASSG